jgi:hypothetical protein
MSKLYTNNFKSGNMKSLVKIIYLVTVFLMVVVPAAMADTINIGDYVELLFAGFYLHYGAGVAANKKGHVALFFAPAHHVAFTLTDVLRGLQGDNIEKIFQYF